MYNASFFILYYDQNMREYFTNYTYIADQHDSSINIQTVYTTTTQTDVVRIVTSK